MRILYFSSRECWPPVTGGRLRDYHLARELAKRCDLVYLGLSDPGSQVIEQEAPGLPRMITAPRNENYSWKNLLRGLLGPQPVTLWNCVSHAAREQIGQLGRHERFDSIQIEGVHLQPYIAWLRTIAPSAAILGDWHNIESELMARYAEQATNIGRKAYAVRTRILIARHEDRLLSDCDVHTVCSPRDRDLLLHRVPSARIEVVGNGVETAHFHHGALPSSGSNVLFVGSMNYHANIDAVLYFTREVWPLVRAAHPHLHFQIVGHAPTSEVQALAAGDVEVTGSVADVRPYYEAALLLVVPLRVGGGTRLKILEAMAAGIPVVSTTLGAEGLDAEDGVHLRIADSPRSMAEWIGGLASDPPARQKLAQCGRLLAERYDWSRMGELLFALHREISSR